MSKSNNLDGKRRMIIILAVAAAVVIIVLASVIIVLLNRNVEQPVAEVSTAETRGTVITEENAAEVLEELREPSDDNYYRTRMNVEWTFATSRTPSNNAFVANAETNNRTVYFDVILEDTGNPVYSSPFIPVGEELRNFALDAELAAGTYPAVVVYHLVDDDENELTTVSVAVKLHILGA